MQCAVREGADHGAAERGDGHRSCLPWLKSCRTLPAKVGIYIVFLIRLIFVMADECIYVYPQELWGECADVFPLHRLTAFVPTSLYHISSISIFQVFSVASYIVAKYIVESLSLKLFPLRQ